MPWPRFLMLPSSFLNRLSHVLSSSFFLALIGAFNWVCVDLTLGAALFWVMDWVWVTVWVKISGLFELIVLSRSMCVISRVFLGFLVMFKKYRGDFIDKWWINFWSGIGAAFQQKYLKNRKKKNIKMENTDPVTQNTAEEGTISVDISENTPK
jgi:hypothetical protein